MNSPTSDRETKVLQDITELLSIKTNHKRFKWDSEIIGLNSIFQCHEVRFFGNTVHVSIIFRHSSGKDGDATHTDHKVNEIQIVCNSEIAKDFKENLIEIVGRQFRGVTLVASTVMPTF